MVKKRPNALSTVVSFMSQEAQERIAESQNAERIAIDAIRPDPEQPRQLLGEHLQELLRNGVAPTQVMETWVDATEDKGVPRWFLQQFQELRTLADSIAQHGLINAITVRPAPKTGLQTADYIIVTGERRYWAHVLLTVEGKTIQEGNIKVEPTEIKATIVPEGTSIRAHQLIENIVREDINAVERAYGLEALRLEMSGVNHGSRYQEKDLVTWGDVEKTLNISTRYRQYLTSVLKLNDDAKNIIQQFNMRERTIRPIIQKLSEYPALQLQALRQVGAWMTTDESDDSPPDGSLTHAVTQLADRLLAKTPERTELPAQYKVGPQVKSLRRLLQKIAKADLPPAPYGSEVWDELQGLRDDLDYLLTRR